MLEVWLDTARLEYLIVTKHLKITRIIVKVGLERGRSEGGEEGEIN